MNFDFDEQISFILMIKFDVQKDFSFGRIIVCSSVFPPNEHQSDNRRESPNAARSLSMGCMGIWVAVNGDN